MLREQLRRGADDAGELGSEGFCEDGRRALDLVVLFEELELVPPPALVVDGDGGPIRLSAQGTVHLRDTQVTTSVEGLANLVRPEFRVGTGGAIDHEPAVFSLRLGLGVGVVIW